MRWWWQNNPGSITHERAMENLGSHGRNLKRKYWIALSLYAVLGLLVWFTVGEGRVIVFGKPVELRLIPMLILATFALRTVLVRQADKIRHGGE